MTLVDVYPSTPVFFAHCSRCGAEARADRGLTADLDATPGTYYCAECAATLRREADLLEAVS